jgi:hypothetical protein
MHKDTTTFFEKKKKKKSVYRHHTVIITPGRRQPSITITHIIMNIIIIITHINMLLPSS